MICRLGERIQYAFRVLRFEPGSSTGSRGAMSLGASW
jgi:hypothetical protein